MFAHNRLFSYYYDSVVQAERRDIAIALNAKSSGSKDVQVVEESVAKRCLARLRFDSLLMRSVVLTDTQVLDGTAFHTHSFGNILSAVRRFDGAPPPLIVRSRSSDLAQSVVGLVKRANEQMLRGFRFSSIRDAEKRRSVAAALKKVPAENVRSWEDVPTVLVQCGADKRDTEAMRMTWDSLISAQKNGELKVENWTLNGGATRATLTWPLDSLKATLKSGVGAELSNWFTSLDNAQKGDRSSVYEHLDSLRASLDPDSESTREVNYFRAWYDHHYNEAIAKQHDAFPELALGPDGQMIEPCDGVLDVRDAKADLQLPEIFLEALALMPDKKFVELQAPEQMNRHWQYGNAETLKAVLEPYIKYAEGQFHPTGLAKWLPSSDAARATVAFIGAALGGYIQSTYPQFQGVLNPATGAVAGNYLVVWVTRPFQRDKTILRSILKFTKSARSEN